ncbi:hypothetical protein SMICM304S_05576 [Streptomyces microflavus]
MPITTPPSTPALTGASLITILPSATLATWGRLPSVKVASTFWKTR